MAFASRSVTQGTQRPAASGDPIRTSGSSSTGRNSGFSSSRDVGSLGTNNDYSGQIYDKNEHILIETVVPDLAGGSAGAYGEYVYDTVTMPDGSVLQNPYKPTFEEWQYIAEYLNGKVYWNTAKKRAAETAYNKYQQYIQWWNDQQNNEFNTDWNSEGKQINREVDALLENGLNVDFTGLSGGTAANVGTNNSPSQVQPGASEAEGIGFVRLGLEAVQTAVSVATGVAGIGQAAASIANIRANTNALPTIIENTKATTANLQESLKGLQLSNASSVLNFANQMYDFLPNDFFETYEEDYTGLIAPAKVDDLANHVGITDPEHRKLFSNLMRSPSGSAMMKRWQERRSAEQARQEFHELNQKLDRFTPDNKLFSLQRQYEFRNKVLQQQYDALVLQYKQAVTNSLDPNLEGEAQNWQNRANIAQSKIQVAAKALADNYLAYVTSLSTDQNPLASGLSSVAYNNLIHGTNTELAALAPYIADAYEEVSGYIENPETMPKELKVALMGTAGIGGGYLAYKTFYNNLKNNLELAGMIIDVIK